MTGQTITYAGEDDAEELRQAIEAGRKHKIAAEVWADFLDSRKEEIIRLLETGHVQDKEYMSDLVTELRVLQKFRDVCNKMIQLGEIAEERMNEIGG